MDPLIIAAATAPKQVYPLGQYEMDRHEKEPIRLPIAALVWGFMPAAILSLAAHLSAF